MSSTIHQEMEAEAINFCRLTQRIVIVSPMPSSLNPLLVEMTAQCYDVLVLHRPDLETIQHLRAELVILDHTHDIEPVELRMAQGKLVESLPVLHLVGKEAYLRRQGSPTESFCLWPASVPQALEQIRSLSDRWSGMQAAAEDGRAPFKDLVVDVKRLSVYQGERRIELTKTEFELFRMLWEAKGAVLSRQDLMDRVWGEHYFGGSNTVDVHLKSLRHKLGDNPKAPKYIATVRGVGYRLYDEMTS